MVAGGFNSAPFSINAQKRHAAAVLKHSVKGCMQSILAFVAISTTLLLNTDAIADQTVAPVNNSAASAPALVIGDRVQISFYERLAYDDDKWARQQGAPLRTLHLLTDLSGEYVVQEDGAVSLPLLGRAHIEGLSGGNAEAFLANLAQTKMGRTGFVTIALLERPPVYITGAVKNSGAYKLAPRMTIGQVVALAGGIQRGTCDAWQAAESVREQGSRDRSLRRLAQLFARRAVLKAERDGTTAVAPISLTEIVGRGEATEMIAEVETLRSHVRSSRTARETNLNNAVDAAKKELEASLARLAPLKATADMRDKRFQNLKQMASSGLVKQSVSLEAQAELSEVQIRFQDASVAVEDAKRKLSQSIDERTRYQTETRLDLDHEYQMVDDDISDSSHAAVVSADVLDVLSSKLAPGAANLNSTITYVVIRGSTGGRNPLPAVETSELRPGDLIRVSFSSMRPALGTESTQAPGSNEEMHD